MMLLMARRSPGACLVSVIDVRKRLNILRHLFHQSIHIKQGAQPANQLEPQFLKVLDPELSGEPQALAHAVRATTHYPTYPQRAPGADLPPKKVCNLDPMAPRSRQKRQLPEGPQ